ncbi:MAG: hypothetical protein KJ970_10695, partial [Candidatus Eisenbacteria bacterium]|nr:hypothetical protein [Candidatus Eisenbacteria bacterium]MBU2691382.1 hypothetical protein [Candidatus Eisenbacteria bacterium]
PPFRLEMLSGSMVAFFRIAPPAVIILAICIGSIINMAMEPLFYLVARIIRISKAIWAKTISSAQPNIPLMNIAMPTVILGKPVSRTPIQIKIHRRTPATNSSQATTLRTTMLKGTFCLGDSEAFSGDGDLTVRSFFKLSSATPVSLADAGITILFSQ